MLSNSINWMSLPNLAVRELYRIKNYNIFETTLIIFKLSDNHVVSDQQCSLSHSGAFSHSYPNHVLNPWILFRMTSSFQVALN